MKAAMQGLAQTQNHDHNHQRVLSDLISRVKALKSLLVEKAFVDPAALDTLIKQRLLTDLPHGVTGYGG